MENEQMTTEEMQRFIDQRTNEGMSFQEAAVKLVEVLGLRDKSEK